MREPGFKEVAEFGHGADGGAGGFNGVCLLDGDGGADIFNGVDIGPIHDFEELASIGAKGFDVPALALCV